MASIFDELFTDGNAPRIYPTVDLDRCTFTLVGIEPYRDWVDSGQVKEDGTPKRVQSDQLTYDESGERVRVVLSFVLTDARNISTSASVPLVDRTHFLDAAKVKALQGARGQLVKLTRPRIEFREQAQQYDPDKPKRWQKVETKMTFAFDDLDV